MYPPSPNPPVNHPSSPPFTPIFPPQTAQPNSPFLTHLPLELRRQIYTHVFTPTPTTITVCTSPSSSSHPLSLLLTSRQIHTEAARLAFRTYTFALPLITSNAHAHLTQRAAHLSPSLKTAIRSLSAPSTAATIPLLSSALVLFPGLTRFVLRADRAARRECMHSSIAQLLELQLQRSRSTAPSAGDVVAPGGGDGALEAETHDGEDEVDDDDDDDPATRAVQRYVPAWFRRALAGLQDMGRWEVRWPQLESGACYSEVQGDGSGRASEEWRMDGDAIGVVDGVRECVCGVRDVTWTRAVLVQKSVVLQKGVAEIKGGREVVVELAYCEGVEAAGKDGVGVVLVPGTAPASETVLLGDGIRYRGADEYWEAVRRKNGDWGALWRGFWKRAAA